jgi:hypothetical protein
MSRNAHSVHGPVLVDETNLSRAWSRAFLHALDNPGTTITPLILSVTGFDEHGVPQEDEAVRRELDKVLLSEGKHLSSADVAYTIFPQRLWLLAKGDRSKLFDYYRMAFPRYQAMNRRSNRRGLYFERLVSYGRGPESGNQLEWILKTFNSRGGVRRSMLQASVFDPERDHVPDAQLQFPCMQQISFEPTKQGLVMNAFYATQQLFVKAYGNYLGLAQLGAFMAQEMSIPLSRLNVVVGIAKLEKVSKSDAALVGLIDASRQCLKDGAAELECEIVN